MHRPRRLSLSLLALALFVRALVPTGWMPAPADGGLALVPCPTSGPAPVAPAAMAGHGHHDPAAPDKAEHQAASETCPFGAMAGATAALPPAPALFVDAPAALPATSSPRALAPRAPPRLRPPARGPPSLA